jgi:hypothetical protein
MPIPTSFDDSILHQPCTKQFCGSREFNGALSDGSWQRHRVTRALAGELKAWLPPERVVVLAESAPRTAECDFRLSRDVVLGLRGMLHRTLTLPDLPELQPQWRDLPQRPFTLLLVTVDPRRPVGALRLVASWPKVRRPSIRIWEMPPSLPSLR